MPLNIIWYRDEELGIPLEWLSGYPKKLGPPGEFTLASQVDSRWHPMGLKLIFHHF